MITFSLYRDGISYRIMNSFWTDSRYQHAVCIVINLFENISARRQISINKGTFQISMILCFEFCNNTTCRCHVRNTIDQDQLTQCFVFGKFIDHDLFLKKNVTNCNFILGKRICQDLFSGIYINFILNVTEYTRNLLRTNLYNVIFSNAEWCIIHPENRRCKRFADRKFGIFG